MKSQRTILFNRPAERTAKKGTTRPCQPLLQLYNLYNHKQLAGRNENIINTCTFVQK